MHMKTRFAFLLVVLLALMLPTSALADGIIIPEPPPCRDCPPPPCPGPFPCPIPSPMVQLVIRYHKVDIEIQDQVAVTHVDQVFYNPNEWAVEGTYLFPLPKEAAVSSFTLWVDGEPVQGEILEAEQARQKYYEIVSSLRDPALLEYAGSGAVQAHIFPIPPGGERRVELEYTQALPAENGLVRYVYPLSTEKFSAWPLESVSISADIRANVPIRAVYSPSHKVDVQRESETHVRAGYEAQNVLPDADFALYYSLGETQAFHLLSYRDPSDESDPDGFFLALMAPSTETSQEALPKDVLLVLDRSGSMEGEKFLQAQEALRYILQHLNPQDRFYILAFSTGMEEYANQLRSVEDAPEALNWVDRLGAGGSTDINRALLEAASVAENERPTYLIFLTDGLPTEGVVDSQEILDNFPREAPEDLRLFAFGVGFDVDTFLLDSLAEAHHGSSTYVLPGESLDEALSAFYARISAPVLTDLDLDFDDLRVYDLYPSPLPDLFRGSQIIVVGRYREGGVADVTLTGKVNEQTETFVFEDQEFARDSRGADTTLTALPRLWATRKIGYLLNQIRLHGPDQETIDQIVKLSIRYGIVTPYTSYLVTEPLPLGVAEQERIAAQQYSQMQATAAPPPSGQDAVQKAAAQGGMAAAEAPAAPAEGTTEKVRIAGGRTFVFADDQWIDTAFDPEQMKPIQVPFLSEEYFALAQARPELAAAFALGEKVIAISDGKAYQVVEEGAPVEPVSVPPTSTPAQITEGAPISTEEAPAATESVAPAVSPSAPETGLPKAPAQLPCIGGLLPLVLLPFGLFIWRRII